MKNSFTLWHNKETGEVFFADPMVAGGNYDRYMNNTGWERAGEVRTDLDKDKLIAGISFKERQAKEELKEIFRQVRNVVQMAAAKGY